MSQTIDIVDAYRCQYCGDTRSYDWGLVEVADSAGETKSTCLECYEHLAGSVTVVGD